MSNFNRLVTLTAAQQSRLLGGVAATFLNASDSIPCTVIIDRNVDVIRENGSVLAGVTVINLQKSEVGSVSIEDKIVCGLQSFIVKEILSDDGTVIEVYVRG